MIQPDTQSSRVHSGEAPRSVVVAGVAVAVIGLAACQYYYRTFAVDDAFITFRYAENFARGFGVVFNAGERVEGYTNFLWLVILAGLFRAGADTLLSAKFLGVASGLALVPITSLLAIRCAGRRNAAAVVAPVLLASTPAVAVWSVAGLETTFFAVLVAASVLCFVREGDDPRRFPASAALLVLASMTRPDGVIVAALAGLFALGRWRRDRRYARQSALWLVVFFALAATYMAWRWSYFGYPFPNTFYAKTGRGVVQFLGGVLYTTAGIRKHGGLLFVLIAALPAFYGSARRDRARFLVALVAAWMAYNVYKGHDVLTVFRFFVPILPVLFALAAVALTDLYVLLRAQSLPRTAGVALVALFVAGTLAINAVLMVTSRDPRDQTREYQLQLRLDARFFMPVARRLQELAPEGASIALVDAGVIGYYTGWYVIDRWGLCDEHIAHTEGRGPLGEKFDPDYVLSKKPTFIQTKASARSDRSQEYQGNWAGDRELLARPEFRENYVSLEEDVLRGFFVRRDAGIVTPAP
jgi:hypothetical protein